MVKQGNYRGQEHYNRNGRGGGSDQNSSAGAAGFHSRGEGVRPRNENDTFKERGLRCKICRSGFPCKKESGLGSAENKKH